MNFGRDDVHSVRSANLPKSGKASRAIKPGPARRGAIAQIAEVSRPQAFVMSFTSAPGAFFITDATPFSRDEVEL